MIFMKPQQEPAQTLILSLLERVVPQIEFCHEYTQTKGLYPKRLIGDEGKVGGGRLLPHPFPRDAGAAQELAVGEAGGELQGHVVRRLLLLLRVAAAGQAHVKAEGEGAHGGVGGSDGRHMSPATNLG